MKVMKSADTLELNGIERGDIGVITLRNEDVRLMKRDEILHVRELHTAQSLPFGVRLRETKLCVEALDEEIDYRLSIQVMSEAKIAYLREKNFQFAQNLFRDAVSAQFSHTASPEFGALYRGQGPFDYVLNLSALKHVRSEKDPYSLMRMLQVNNVAIAKTLALAAQSGGRKYFSVSTDKAANPVNLMGASKRIMERILCAKSADIEISSARYPRGHSLPMTH